MLTLWINWACETKNTILCQVSLFTEDMREDTTNAIENYSKILASKPEWVLRIQAFYKLHIHWTIWTSDLCRLSGTFFVQDHCKYKITLKKKIYKRKKNEIPFPIPLCKLLLKLTDAVGRSPCLAQMHAWGKTNGLSSLKNGKKTSVLVTLSELSGALTTCL